MTVWDLAVCTIFAREFLEGAIIIGQYRTIVLKSEASEEDQQKTLRAISISAALATALAVLVVICVAVPLVILSSKLDKDVVEIIEGISKLVAAICILQLSLKIPKFLGFYASRKKKNNIIGGSAALEGDGVDVEKNSGEVIPGLTLRSVRFNVAWNIWREMAECGVFLIPTFLSGDGEKTEAIPVSAIVGAVIGLLLGFFIYYANQRFKDKKMLCIFAVLLLVFLATGLATGGAHSIEEVAGETKVVYDIEGRFWDKKKLPMAIIRIFGYSNERTVLMITVFWCWLFLSAVLHCWKYHTSLIQPNDTGANVSSSPVEKDTSAGKSGSDGDEMKDTSRENVEA